MPPFERSYGTPDSASASGYSLSSHRQSIVVALLSAGCFAGALLGVPTADYLGRRGAIFLVSVIFIVGAIVQIAPTDNLNAFLAGRFVAGLGVGVSTQLPFCIRVILKYRSVRLSPRWSLSTKEKSRPKPSEEHLFPATKS